jgi:antitoxin component YwqK of YwqJK toxin-antitoxin module
MVGTWIEYHPNGRIKVEGQFKRNESGDWTNAWDKGLCSTRVGTWTYYSKSGTVTETRTFVNGRLVEQP